ncbi:MAG: GyrI-like domain-containing protein [Chloroflexota bacterium]
MTAKQKNTYDVTVKAVPELRVVSLTEAVPDFETSGATNVRLFDTIRERMGAHGIAFSDTDVAVYHGIPGVTELAIEAAIGTDADVPDAVGVDVKVLPAVEQMASLVHYGSFEGYPQAMTALMGWIETNNYKVVGAMRDVYHVFDKDGDPDTFVTELQFPIAPKAE